MAFKLTKRGGTDSNNLGTSSQYNPQPQQPESWGQYGLRNIGGAVESLGKGYEQLAQLLPNPQNTLNEIATQYPERYGALKNTNKSPVLSEELLHLIGKPEGFGKPRNFGESALRFGLTQAPFIGKEVARSAPTLLGKLGGLFKGASTSVGALAGATAGSAVGGEIGKQLGDQERGEAIGGIGGGIAGSLGTHTLFNRPSSTLNPKIYEKEVNNFKTDIRDQLNKLSEEYVPALKKGKSDILNQKLDLAKQEEIFNKTKQKSIVDIQKKYNSDLKKNITDRKKQLKDVSNQEEFREKKIKEYKEKSTPLYEKSFQIGEKISVPAKKLQDKLIKMERNLSKSLSPSEKRKLLGFIEDINKNVKPDGSINVKPIIEVKQDVGETIYKKNSQGTRYKDTVLGKRLQKLRVELKDELKDIAKDHPEFNEVFTPAEEYTQKAGDLLNYENVDKFEAAQKEAIREINENFRHKNTELGNSFRDAKQSINSEKFPAAKQIIATNEIQEAQKQLGATQKEFDQARKQLDNKTYEDVVKDKQSQNKLIQAFEEYKPLLDRFGWSTLGTGISLLFGGDVQGSLIKGFGAKILREAGRDAKAIVTTYNNHPELLADYNNILAAAVKKDIPKGLALVKQHEEKVKNLTEIPPTNKSSGFRLIKRGS